MSCGIFGDIRMLKVVRNEIATILDVSHTGTKEDVGTRVADFLLEPKSSGRPLSVKSKGLC